MTRAGATAAGLLAWLAASSALAAPPPGAASCSGCHAPSGGQIASLEGRPADELAAAMIAFRKGEREATVMNRIAKGFSDAEIRAIADWLAARPTRGPRPQP